MHNVSSTAREPSCFLLKREFREMKHFTWYAEVGCCDSEKKVACNQLQELLLATLTLHFMQAGPASSRAQVSLREKVFKPGVQSVTYNLGTYILLGQDTGPSRSNSGLFWRHTERVPLHAVAASLHITDLVANVHIFTAATLSVVPAGHCVHARMQVTSIAYADSAPNLEQLLLTIGQSGIEAASVQLVLSPVESCSVLL